MEVLGFTQNESKIYCSLISKYPVTGYQLAADSGVPRYAVYGLLNKMEARGYIQNIGQKPARYIPLSPDALAEKVADSFNTRLEEFQLAAADLEEKPLSVRVWPLQDKAEIFKQAAMLISGATQSVCISAWQSELRELQPALAQLEAKNIIPTLFSFTPLNGFAGHCFSYNIEEDVLEKYWPHKLFLVIDGTKMLMCGLNDQRQAQGLWGEDATLIDMVKNQMALDLTLWSKRTGRSVDHVMGPLVSHQAPIDDLLQTLGGVS